MWIENKGTKTYEMCRIHETTTTARHTKQRKTWTIRTYKHTHTHSYKSIEKWRLYRNNWVFCIRLLITMFMLYVAALPQWDRKTTEKEKKQTHSSLCYILFSIRRLILLSILPCHFFLVSFAWFYFSIFFFACNFNVRAIEVFIANAHICATTVSNTVNEVRTHTHKPFRTIQA